MAVGVRLAARLSAPIALPACSSSSRCEARSFLPLQRFLRPSSDTGRPSSGTKRCLLKEACALSGSWGCDWRQSAFTLKACRGRRRSGKGLVVCEIGGDYSENFDDVEKHLVDYFTYKGVKTVLAQLLEMNPGEYRWFYSFVVEHQPQDSVVFIRALVKEKQELAERVMVTRLHLFNQWIKKYNHADLYDNIQKQNLALLRERLMQTVRFDVEPEDRPV